MGVPLIVNDASAVTWMLNAGRAAEAEPSLTLMTMLANVPTSELVGVPLSLPVLVLKVAQEGMFWMLKLSVAPDGPVAVGVKEYSCWAVTCAPGVPLIVGAGGGVPLETVCVVASVLPPPPQAASAAIANMHNAMAPKRGAIGREALFIRHSMSNSPEARAGAVSPLTPSLCPTLLADAGAVAAGLAAGTRVLGHFSLN